MASRDTVLPSTGAEHAGGEAYIGSSGRQSPAEGSGAASVPPLAPLSFSPPPKRAHDESVNGSRDSPLSAPQTRCPSPSLPVLGPVEDEYEEMTIAEIINGKGEGFPGLLGVVNAYLNTLNVDFASKKRMRTYLNLIKWRADGKFPHKTLIKATTVC